MHDGREVAKKVLARVMEYLNEEELIPSSLESSTSITPVRSGVLHIRMQVGFSGLDCELELTGPSDVIRSLLDA